MKLKNLIPHRFSNRIVQRFGAAHLVRNADGTHALIGGTRDDIAAANEWISLFAHDIVFSVSRRQPDIAFNNNIGMFCRQKRLGWRQWTSPGGGGF